MKLRIFCASALAMASLGASGQRADSTVGSAQRLNQTVDKIINGYPLLVSQSALWDELNNDPSLKDCRDADWPDTATCNYMARATMRIARQYWVRDHAKRTLPVKQK